MASFTQKKRDGGGGLGPGALTSAVINARARERIFEKCRWRSRERFLTLPDLDLSVPNQKSSNCIHYAAPEHSTGQFLRKLRSLCLREGSH